MNSGKPFFEEAEDQSVVKATIVSKYFFAWFNVIKNAAKLKSNRVAYIDLFAGPGRYKDGSKSTPLLILEQAIQDQDLKKMLVTIFNDADEASVSTLKNEILSLEGIDELKHPPKVFCNEVGDAIVENFENMKFIPTLLFVDPFGYKGLSLRLINSVLRHWGCDCIFFFNYNRINMGLGNLSVKRHMDELFGVERAEKLRTELQTVSPPNREFAIIEKIAEALQEDGGEYVLPFRFRRVSGTRTSHHLIFVSKNIRGYSIMKDIMAKENSGEEQSVPTFEYNPAWRKQGLLFELSRPLDDLEEMLLKKYAGKTLTLKDIFEDHNIGTRYVIKNYKDALKKMEAAGKISANPSAEKRKKNTFANHVKVTFPD